MNWIISIKGRCREEIPGLPPEEKGIENSGSAPDGGGATPTEKVHPLYGHGVCKWPGCEVICIDIPAFIK